MKAVAFSLSGLWWLPVFLGGLALLYWQRRRLRLSPLRWAAFSLLLAAFLNPVAMLQLRTAAKADFNLQIVKPNVLLVEYGEGNSYLGTVLGKSWLGGADVVSPENLPLVTDMVKRYDVVALHATKNLQVYTDFLSDWRSFPNRSKLESTFADYGAVFDNGTKALPEKLDNYGLVIIAGADIRPEDTDRLLEYVKNGGRLMFLLHAAGGLAINPPGSITPWCVLYHHPPFGDRPFPAEWLQRNVGTLLQKQLGVRSMMNVSCIYGQMKVRKSGLSALQTLYGEGKLYPSSNIDGKNLDELVWSTAFLDLDASWQPLLTVDTKISGEPRGHGTPIPVPVNDKPVAIAREYGKGRVFVFGLAPVNYGLTGIPPSMFLAAAPYIASEVTYDDKTSRALSGYVAEGGNLVVVGPSVPRSSGPARLLDLLPVNLSGPPVTETTKAVFRDPKHPLLSGISPFNVSHYRVTGAKAAGEVLAADGKNNPLLVSSYYGLGKVVYYLPEIPAEATLDNTAPPEFWLRLVAWLSPSATSTPGLTPRLPLRSSQRAPVSLHLWDAGGKAVEKAQVSCSYLSPKGETATVSLKETSGGVYDGELPLSSPGDYRVWFDVKAGTAMRTSRVDLEVRSSPLAAVPHSLWRAAGFFNGYRTAMPAVMPLHLWQLLVLAGASLLCIDWVKAILRGRLYS